MAGRFFDQVFEVVVLGDEIGFGVDLGDRPFAMIVADFDADGPFAGDAARFFGRAAETLFTEPLDGGFHVSVGFGQGLFTIHHPRIGHLAELFNHRCRDCHDYASLLSSAVWASSFSPSATASSVTAAISSSVTASSSSAS